MKRLLCTDLDGTLFPAGGTVTDAPRAKSLIRELAGREDIMLAYVTGRHRALIEQAIAEHDLPLPDFAIADVGSTIYQVDASGWQVSEKWHNLIGRDWHDWAAGDIYRLLSVFPDLRLQESEKQGRYKLSFYLLEGIDTQRLLVEIDARLKHSDIRANLIWSVDPRDGTGLLDILPAGANKLHAIRFLMKQMNLSQNNMVFAGDSGNDLDVLISGLQTVLVANADSKMKEVADSGLFDASLYVAKGGFLGFDGTCSSGVLEGVAHFWPEIGDWLKDRPQ